MQFQNTVEVNPVENDRSAIRDAYEIRAIMFLECATVGAKVLGCFLAVVATLVHFVFPASCRDISCDRDWYIHGDHRGGSSVFPCITNILTNDVYIRHKYRAGLFDKARGLEACKEMTQARLFLC